MFCVIEILYAIIFSYFLGKFQLQVLPQSGHAVQEDVPDKVAEALATFMVRHKFAEPESTFERYVNLCRLYSDNSMYWILSFKIII